MDIEKDKIYSVSEFVAVLNADLKWMKAKIVGEVGEAKAGPTGHMYFTLKEANDAASVKTSAGQVKILTKKPITASRDELGQNPRSRSAKLRAAVKL